VANEIALTTAAIGVVDPSKAVIKDYIAGGTITKGQPVAMDTDGTVDPADGNGSGYLAEQCVGVALQAAGAGQVVPVLENGEVYGYTVSAMDCGALIYLSDTVGRLSTVAGTKTTILGRVTALTDKSATKVACIQMIFAKAVPT
jgi:hypothetical protein